ncbi:hypothetical protein OG749_05445 [Streptomyces nojiriensis]|uniref:hypothetical protein n=1 Tax=Streptomyces nojiriensis TaxID=66374 RepID=UPI002E189CB8
MQIHTLMELLPENGLIAALAAVGAYWSPKITRARTWIARSVAPKAPVHPADTACEEIIQVRERV